MAGIVGRKASYIYVEFIIGVFTGYVLWLFVTRLTTPDVIGISSTLISFTLIFSVVVDLGVSYGSTRFLGKSFSSHDVANAKTMVQACLFIVCAAFLVYAVVILALRGWIYPNVELVLVVMSISLVGASVIYNLLRSIVVSSLQTERLPLIMIISSSAKFVITVFLVLMGAGAIGIIIGYVSTYVLGSILLSLPLIAIFKPVRKKTTIPLYAVSRKILPASMAGWLPRVVAVVGSRLGTVIVFGIEGASQAGFYFIASSIFYAIAAVADSMFSVSFPILSAMNDCRKRLVWKMMKLSLVISLPISSAASAYSDEILEVFGPEYIQASVTLKIMLLSMLTITFSIAISTLVYSYGNYRQVLEIGLSSSISRILCYMVLVPAYGITGAAISFSIGSIIGFAVSVIVARKVGMLIFWKDVSLIFVIPTGLAAISEYFQFAYFIGIPIILIISIVSLSAMRVLSKSEIRDSLTILPNRVRKPLRVLFRL